MSVRKMLISKYGGRCKNRTLSQQQFWNETSSMLVSVCVPGHNNNMLDRGQIQSMAFGGCTISPYLPEVLPFDRRLVEGEHYIMCKDDYSDLVEKVEWCKENRKICVDIGNNAKQLFSETSKPNKLWEWISIHL